MWFIERDPIDMWIGFYLLLILQRLLSDMHDDYFDLTILIYMNYWLYCTHKRCVFLSLVIKSNINGMLACGNEELRPVVIVFLSMFFKTKNQK